MKLSKKKNQKLISKKSKKKKGGALGQIVDNFRRPDEEGKCKFVMFAAARETFNEKKLFKDFDSKPMIKANKELLKYFETAFRNFCVKDVKATDRRKYLKYCGNMLKCMKTDMMNDIVYSLYNQDFDIVSYKEYFKVKKSKDLGLTQEQFQKDILDENINQFADFMEKVIIKSILKMNAIKPDLMLKLPIKKNIETFLTSIGLSSDLKSFSKDKFIDKLKDEQTKNMIERKIEEEIGEERPELDIDTREYHKDKTPRYFFVVAALFLLASLMKADLLDAPPDMGPSYL